MYIVFGSRDPKTERKKMKKLITLTIMLSLVLLSLFIPKTYAYTLSNVYKTYYNQTTDSIGNTDTLDISSTYVEHMYYNLGYTSIDTTTPIRVVFSNQLPTQLLPKITNDLILSKVSIDIYSINNILLYREISYYNLSTSFSYFETNFIPDIDAIDVDYMTIKIENLPIGYNEADLHYILNGAIIAYGHSMIINQPIDVTQYQNGWADAMNSKVTQIWSLWGNIFDTFMNVFDIFSVKLMGDITIGHIALVPLVLGLIGFIYALGGKRGR